MPVSKKFEQTLDDVIYEFRDSVSNVHFSVSHALSVFKNAHSTLLKQSDCSQLSRTTMLYLRDWYSSTNTERFSFASVERTNKELVRNLEEDFNNQLRWQLVTLFELHERFIKDLYAAIGFLDYSYWRGVDMGKGMLSEVRSKDVEWFRRQVRKIHRSNCNEIYSQLKQICQEFKSQDEHLTFTRIVFEKLRHIIVHQQGESDDVRFWDAIKKGHGVSLDGDTEGPKNLRKAVERVVPLRDGVRRIWLINDKALTRVQMLPVGNKPGPIEQRDPTYHALTRPFDNLRDFIIDYTCMTYAMVIRKFDKEPFWKREKPQ